ncbi:hypothetical protein C943_04174 [Mariniradius saccharolyticus AK6]|uniref:Uncharacterized protein n=1 Tax=Mariniradius saccharolyticus AK6 TaxID=1239962 RepID=M7X8Z0_9BACT|nr:hypothetical protein C943_04174 [Mariniradius saccharolyticus AK6]
MNSAGLSHTFWIGLSWFFETPAKGIDLWVLFRFIEKIGTCSRHLLG